MQVDHYNSCERGERLQQLQLASVCNGVHGVDNKSVSVKNRVLAVCSAVIPRSKKSCTSIHLLGINQMHISVVFIAAILHLTGHDLPTGVQIIYRTDGKLFN